MSSWGPIILWVGLQVCTWLESKPRLVDGIESALIWIDRRSGWWVLAAFILWAYVGQGLVIALVEAVNPPWPIALLVGFSWAIGFLTILGWGVMKLFTCGTFGVVWETMPPCGSNECVASNHTTPRGGTLMRKWLLPLGLALLLGCNSPLEPPPRPPSEPTRISVPVPATYKSVVAGVQANVEAIFPSSNVGCESINQYHKMSVELISCVVYDRSISLMMVSISTYDMLDRSTIGNFQLAISPAETGVVGHVVVCNTTYHIFASLDQHCEYAFDMSMEEFADYTESFLTEWEKRLEAENLLYE